MISNCKAFTLMELLVCIVVISLLASMLMTTIPMIRNAASAVNCSSKLRQIGLALVAYSADHEGFWPAPKPDYVPAPFYWSDALWPFAEEGTLANAPKALVKRSIFACPVNASATLAYKSLAGYGMVANLPPSTFNTPLASSRFLHPRIALARSTTTTPVIGDSMGIFHLQPGQGTPQGGWHLGPLGSWEVSNLLGYQHGKRANLLFADGHAVSTFENAARTHLQYFGATPPSTGLTY